MGSTAATRHGRGSKPALRIAFFDERPRESMPPYVLQDLVTLESLGEVRWAAPVERPGWRTGLGPRGWMPSVDVRRLIRWCDVAVQWFANSTGPALWARLWRKPFIVVAGGYDVAHVPEAGYGLMIDRRTRWMAQAALSLSSRALAVSRFTLSETRRWAPRADARLLHLGFDADAFKPSGQKARRVVTVSRVGSDWVRKGLALFVAAARELPDVPFWVIGPIAVPALGRQLQDMSGPNVVFAGPRTHAEVADELRRSAVYAQLSLHESFCCGLAEAMLCGCTPVVAECGALPEVAGDCAYYARPRDPQAAAAAIRAALSAPTGVMARDRISTLFPAAARARGLAAHVFGVAGSWAEVGAEER